MDFKKRLREIRDFLKPYQNIWQNEIMLMYPDPLQSYPIEWIEDLRRFKDKKDLIRIEKKDVFSYIENPSLIAFYKGAEDLCKLPQKENHPPMPESPWTWLFMIPKKQHEIRNIAPSIHHLYQKNKIDRVVDIGGGIGLLAQTLNNQYKMKVTSVDMDPVLQKTGFNRHENNAKDPENKVQYVNLKVSHDDEFSSLLENKVMPVGLHTCGKLALDIIQVSARKKVPALINFGCCYHTLDAKSGLQNISEFAKNNDPLWLNKFALTVSCRAHKKLDDKDFNLKQKVKYYRYAIHVMLHDLYQVREFRSLGNSHPKLYDRPFSEYALEQLRRLEIEPKYSAEELDAFYNNPNLHLLIDRMLAAGLIRNVLGRLLELYLLLDRAIYLEEQGYKVRMEEFFDEEVSPRNIGITAELL